MLGEDKIKDKGGRAAKLSKKKKCWGLSCWHCVRVQTQDRLKKKWAKVHTNLGEISIS